MTVYVTNPDNPAYSILKKSDLYNLTDDEKSPNQLTLDHFEVIGDCGLGIIVPLYTLGIIPYSDTERADLYYTITTSDSSQKYLHHLIYRMSLSSWNTLFYLFYDSRENVQAKALSSSQREPAETGYDRDAPHFYQSYTQ